VVRGLGVDVHHGPHYTMPLALGLPAVVTIHDLSFFTHPEWHQRTKVAFFTSAIRTSAARAAALVAVSATTAALLGERVRPRAPVHVVPHGVDHARFRPDGPRLEHAGVRAPYVAFVGTLEPRKDVPTLIAAFDHVAAAWPELTLVLAGGRGWGVDAVDRAVAAARHRDRITGLGYLPEEDLPALLRGAAAVAYPSLEEGFGLPVLEALACGAPVVTTSGTVMEEVAGGAALLAPPGDVDELARALDAALAGGPAGDERRRLGLEVAARYTWEASAAGHAEVYAAAAR
jgi:glycosyltransferase involved in cell wall biosynthesis